MCRTGVSYWYNCFHCFCPGAMTSTSLYSTLLFFWTSAILDFATSQREQLERVKRVNLALYMDRGREGRIVCQ